MIIEHQIMKRFFILGLTCSICITEIIAQDTITRADFSIGQKFLDLSFTNAEIDSMYSVVTGNLREVKKMHSQPLSNNIPMALLFDPVVPGMKFNMKQGPVK